MLSIGHPLLGDGLYAHEQALAAWPRCACMRACSASPIPKPANACVSSARHRSEPRAQNLWEHARSHRIVQIQFGDQPHHQCDAIYQANTLNSRHCCLELLMREELNQGLIDFLKASPTPFHATASLVQRLEAAGYQRLDEREPWATETNGRYYVTRNDSSIVAIKLGRTRRCTAVSAWSAPTPTARACGSSRSRNCSARASGSWASKSTAAHCWPLVRPRPVAGRPRHLPPRRQGRKPADRLQAPIAIIPNLAIHLNREANKAGRSTRRPSCRRSLRSLPVTNASTSAPCSPSSWPASTA
jgi:aspartyl aminopeptidase